MPLCPADGDYWQLTLHAADLVLNGKQMTVTILSPAGATFQTLQPTRLATDPPLPAGWEDEPNPGVNVLAINIAAGTTTVSVLFSPNWNSSYTASTPPQVPLSSWSLTSHN